MLCPHLWTSFMHNTSCSLTRAVTRNLIKTRERRFVTSTGHSFYNPVVREIFLFFYYFCKKFAAFEKTRPKSEKKRIKKTSVREEVDAATKWGGGVQICSYVYKRSASSHKRKLRKNSRNLLFF